MINDNHQTNPVEMVFETACNIAKTGTATQFIKEICKLPFSTQTDQLGENMNLVKNPSWIGRQLRNLGVIDKNVDSVRQIVDGKFVRLYPLNSEFLERVNNTVHSG